MRFLSLFLLLALSGAALAGNDEIPLNELGFIDTIKSASKERIVDQLGEPARMVEVTNENGEVFASIWHYYYLNTTEDGDYYKTTELDFVGDRVVTVVFSNTEPEENGIIAASTKAE